MWHNKHQNDGIHFDKGDRSQLCTSNTDNQQGLAQKPGHTAGQLQRVVAR